MATIFKKYQHIQVGRGQKKRFYKCVVADKTEAAFARLLPKKGFLRTDYNDIFVVSNDQLNDFSYAPANLSTWDGKSLKKYCPIKNAAKPSHITESGTLIVWTKNDKLYFRKGDCINQVNGNLLTLGHYVQLKKGK